jgi:signal peptidase II
MIKALKEIPRKTLWIHLGILVFAILSDQASKLWAMARFNGIPRGETIQVIGDWWRFQLAFNEGAAFSMRPQELIPFLHPTLFYMLLGTVALIGLSWFYIKLPTADWPSRWGSVLILGGALGNLIDRFRLHKVIDFIDWDFPNVQIGSYYMERWPTFNLADSWVLIGVGLIFLSPWLMRWSGTELPTGETANTHADAGTTSDKTGES